MGAWAKDASVKTPSGSGCEFVFFHLLRFKGMRFRADGDIGDKTIITNDHRKPAVGARMRMCALPGGEPNTSHSAARPPNSPWGSITPRSSNDCEFSVSFS